MEARLSLEEFVRNLQFMPCIEEIILKELSKKELVIQEISKTAYLGSGYDYPLLKRKPFTRLLVVCYLLRDKFQDYKKIGVSEEIIWDTFQDVSIRSNLNYLATAKIGISKEEVQWFTCLMNCTIFKIGVLQYEITKMSYPDKRNTSEPFMYVSKEWKERLPEGTDVLSCHIRHGVDLSDKAVDASLHKAKKFFSEYYSNMNFTAYICSSWLLYPPMQEVLGEKSNIGSFASRFKIIAACPDYRQAMERIFSYTGKTLPKEKQSSLQKLALQDKKRLGYAMGIISIP